MLAPPIASVAARADRPRLNRMTWAPMKRRNCRASNESSTDLPAPVGPTTRVWPTSPTCRSSRNGVLPRVSAIIRGGEPMYGRHAWPVCRLAIEVGGGIAQELEAVAALDQGEPLRNQALELHRPDL